MTDEPKTSRKLPDMPKWVEEVHPLGTVLVPVSVDSPTTRLNLAEAESLAKEVLVRMLDEAGDVAVSTDPISVAARAIMIEREHRPAIAVEIYRALQKLGAKSDLLAIVGSYGDTQSDAWTLDQLRRYNETIGEPNE